MIFTGDSCVFWVTQVNVDAKLLGCARIIVSEYFKFFGIIKALEAVALSFDIPYDCRFDGEELGLQVDELIIFTKAKLYVGTLVGFKEFVLELRNTVVPYEPSVLS